MAIMRRRGIGRAPAAVAVAPTVIGSALTAQKETEGTNGFSATAGVGTAGATLLSWVGIKTALFSGPVTGNNGNTHTQQFSQAYPTPFTMYSLKGFRCVNAAGTSNHSVSGTKSSGDAEEVTIALLALSGGSIVDSSITQQDNAGAGHTFTSGSVTVSGNALLVAVASGDGDVNATTPTQTWPGTWTVHQSVAYNSAQAPNGHIPLYVATRSVAAGTYTVDVQVTIDEGLIMALYAVQ
jgi:hypothetical protein